jgi:hypothetical protein
VHLFLAPRTKTNHQQLALPRYSNRQVLESPCCPLLMRWLPRAAPGSGAARRRKGSATACTRRAGAGFLRFRASVQVCGRFPVCAPVEELQSQAGSSLCTSNPAAHGPAARLWVVRSPTAARVQEHIRQDPFVRLLFRDMILKLCCRDRCLEAYRRSPGLCESPLNCGGDRTGPAVRSCTSHGEAASRTSARFPRSRREPRDRLRARLTLPSCHFVAVPVALCETAALRIRVLSGSAFPQAASEVRRRSFPPSRAATARADDANRLPFAVYAGLVYCCRVVMQVCVYFLLDKIRKVTWGGGRRDFPLIYLISPPANLLESFILSNYLQFILSI